MKTKLIFTFLLLCFTGAVLFSQAPGDEIGDFSDGVTGGELLSAYNAVYMAIVILVGYITKALKIKYDWNLPGKRLPWVIAAAGLVIGVAWVQAGFSSVLPLIFSFFGSIGLYDLILKPFNLTLKTPLPANKAG